MLKMNHDANAAYRQGYALGKRWKNHLTHPDKWMRGAPQAFWTYKNMIKKYDEAIEAAKHDKEKRSALSQCLANFLKGYKAGRK